MTSPFQPAPCPPGEAGEGSPSADVESNILCDVLPNGDLAGTALAVYEYDPDGNPTGPPTFVDPVTGAPYVAQGILQPCPGDVGCLEPVQFCFTSSTSGPVDHPGRIYDFDLAVNPGFDFTSLIIDGTENVAGITWAVTDPDGAAFTTAVQSFIQNRFTPLGGTVTVTNPNAGAPVCGVALPLQVHIECVRIDQPAPDVVEAVYNAGTDLVQNPAYLTTPPTNLDGPQFVYLQRQDAGGTLNCTSVANRGWETNDGAPGGADFELWGTGPGGLQQQEAATATPRGTPIQEITADFPASGQPTIWQTFQVPAAGNFIATLVHGARDTGETHTIRLSTGDTDATGPGDVINNVTNPVQVTNAGGGSPGPWTQFNQNVALGAGTYTFSLATTNPVGANRGGLFTDMRVYVDAPNTRVTADTDDETCVVTEDETSTTTTCEWWAPLCSAGDITGWKNAETGQVLDNAGFWGQTPSPECCLPEAAGGGGGTVTPGNLVHTYLVCGVVGGVPQTLSRVVYTDQSGGVVAGAFIGAGGGPVVPASYTIGSCDAEREIIQLCDTVSTGPDIGQTTTTPFLRHFSTTGGVVTATNTALDGTTPYVPAGSVFDCHFADVETHIVCDFGNLDVDGNPRQYIQEWIYNQGSGQPFTLSSRNFDGTAYASVGPVGMCPGSDTGQTLGPVCWQSIPPGPTANRGFLALDGNGDPVLYDGTGTVVPAGTYFTVICPEAARTAIVLCDAGNNNQPFVRAFIGSPIVGQSGQLSADDVDLEGNAYVPVGPVVNCAGDAAGSVAEFILCDVEIIPAGPPVERITNGQFAASAAGWTIVGNASWTNNPGYAGPDAALGVLALNGAALPPTAVVSQTVNTGITPGDVFHLQARLGTKSTDSGSVGPIRVLVEVLDGGSTVLYSQQYVPTMLVGGVTIQWPPNGVVNVPGIVATDGTITVRFTDQSGPGGLTGADGAIDAVSLTQQISAGTTTTPFVRKLIQDVAGAVTSVVDLTLDGDPYIVGGTAGICEPAAQEPEEPAPDSESFVLCDATPTRFLRTYTYTAAGAVAAFTDTTLAGAAFAPVGAVGICTTQTATDFDFDQVVLCDVNGTAFIRRFTFNSQTGAVTATVNLTLAGAAFAPVGAVGLCSDCCPQVIGSGCTNTGSGFYTAIRAVTGTITLIDSVTGAAVAAANIVPCPDDATVQTLTAQGRVLTDTTPWTPGADVVGTLTSLTLTGTTGLWDVVDASGTNLTGLPAGLTLTWEADDDNQLTPPQSVTPQAGSSVVAHWTQRP